jgi:hypothetical protein
MWQGMDGLRGPGLSGSGNYLNRSALLFGTPNQKGTYIHYIFTLHLLIHPQQKLFHFLNLYIYDCR